jgi:hypothetical protein
MMLHTSPATLQQPRPTAVLQSWEPPLAEMLTDPVVQAVMKVDGVHAAEIAALMREACERRLCPLSQDS